MLNVMSKIYDLKLLKKNKIEQIIYLKYQKGVNNVLLKCY